MNWRRFLPSWVPGQLVDRRRKLTKDLVTRAGRARATEINALVESLPNSVVRAMEALSGTALGDWGTGGDRELLGYTKLTGRGRDGKLLRDLTSMSQEQQCQVANYLYTLNPLAGWLIDQRVDLLVGAEVGYSIEFDWKKLEITPERAAEMAAEAKETLDLFWDHPAHSIRYRAHEYITTLMVSGELCLLIADQNEVNGVPQLDCIDSQLISGVEPLGSSSMVAGAVLIRKPDGMGAAVQRKTIVRQDAEQERLIGECFFWRNSRILNSMRGRSELMAPADFLDSLDQFMFSQVDRALLQNNVVWRLKLEGATDPQIAKRVQELREQLAKPGGIFGHNEKGELVPASPQFAAAEAGELQRTLANHIRGSKSMPESWYAEGGNANRATASDQTDVAFKSLERWQTLCRRIFNTLLWYTYDNMQALQGGAGFPKRSEGAVTLNADLLPVRERDMGRAAETGAKVEATLEAAIEAELISKKTARKVFLQVVEKISGTAVDPDDEEAAIEAESDEREKEERKRQADAARAGLAPKLGPMPAGRGDDEPPARPPANGNGRDNRQEAVMPVLPMIELLKASLKGGGDTHVHLPEGLVRIPETLSIPAPEVQVDVHVPAAAAPQVDVHVPAQAPPVVLAEVKVPEQVETVDEIEYDSEGRPHRVKRRPKREDE